MTQQGGDRKFGHGDEVTMTYSNADNSVDPAGAGMWVMVDGDLSVDTAESTKNTELDGVLADEVAASEKQNVVFRGMVWARVESGVTGGDELGTGTTAGVAASGGSSGYKAVTDAQEIPSGSGEYYSVVKLE